MNKTTIEKIVKANKVSQGEFILIHFWGEDADRQIANDFQAAVVKCGGTPLVIQQSRTLNHDMFSEAHEGFELNEKYFSLLSSFDAVLDIFTYQPVLLNQPLDEVHKKVYNDYMRKLFPCFIQSKRFTQIRIPSIENALESELEPEDFIRRMEDAYDLDYEELHVQCAKQAEELKDKKQVTLHTGSGCELVFDLSGREWLLDDGDGDWPCGEIYIAPKEDATSGSVYYETLFVEDLGKFNDVTLYIENGKVVKASQDEVDAFFKNQPEENKVVCELGLGMNDKIRDLCGYTVLDEKKAGTFHIAVGGNTMFGGTNEARMHMDMVGYGELTY